MSETRVETPESPSAAAAGGGLHPARGQERCFDVGKQIYRSDAYRFKASLFRF
jgi:hypothetical protein